MSKLKSLTYLAALTAIAAGVFSPESQYQYYSNDYLTDEDINELREKRKLKVQEFRRKGLTEFEIDGYKIYALNRKNAERKLKNLKSKI